MNFVQFRSILLPFDIKTLKIKPSHRRQMPSSQIEIRPRWHFDSAAIGR